jgi:hypothetical protein
MAFELRIRKLRPDLSRVTGVQEPPPAPSRLAFLRGMGLGFLASMMILDYVLLNGSIAARTLFAIRYAIWFIAHTVRG